MGLRATDIFFSSQFDGETVDKVAQLLAARHYGSDPSVVGIPPFNSVNIESTPFLPRLDVRDVVVLKALPPSDGELRIAVSTHPDEPPLDSSIGELLPVYPTAFIPVPAPTDPLARLRSSFSNPALDGSIAPKWLLDELLSYPAIDRKLTRLLNDSIRIVLPCSVRLPLPGQGAITLCHGENCSPASVGCARTAKHVVAEYAASARGERMTIVSRNFGDIVWRSVAGSATISTSIEGRSISLPKAASREAVWPPSHREINELVRVPLATPPFELDPSVGLIVSKAEALPEDVIVQNSTVVLVPGTTTWKKLAQRNVLVHGSFDGLGEDELQALSTTFPEVTRWIKLGHTGAVERDATQLLPTYRLEAVRPAPSVVGYTHFFWKSGSQFEFFLASNPAIRSAWHGSGPGHTHATIVRHIGDRARAGVFTGIEDFLRHVL